MPREPTHLDGNALAGPLSDIFNADVTVASTVCVGCGQRSAIAQLHVYTGGPGSVARCPSCEEVVLRYARTPSHVTVDLRGTVSLSVSPWHEPDDA